MPKKFKETNENARLIEILNDTKKTIDDATRDSVLNKTIRIFFLKSFKCFYYLFWKNLLKTTKNDLKNKNEDFLIVDNNLKNANEEITELKKKLQNVKSLKLKIF